MECEDIHIRVVEFGIVLPELVEAGLECVVEDGCTLGHPTSSPILSRALQVQGLPDGVWVPCPMRRADGTCQHPADKCGTCQILTATP